MTIWCDLEGVNSRVSPKDVIAYCNTWHNEVERGGYKPGLYIGSLNILNSVELDNLKFRHYWKSASIVPKPKRGWQLIQYDAQSQVNNIYIDKDKTQTDKEGEHMYWAVYK